MFNNTKYSRIYTQITDRARGKKKQKGDEFHHIVPDCLGGSRNKDNMVYLTGREHFICHWLLTKMTAGKNKAKMIYALNGMKRANKLQDRYTTKITSRVYARLKAITAKQHSEFMKGRVPPNKGRPNSLEQNEKNRIAATGKRYSAESIAKRVAKVKGQKRTSEQRENISNSLKGKLKGPMSEEEKLKRSIANKGKKRTAEYKAVVAARMKEQFSLNNPNKREDLKKVCPHCNLKTGPSNYARWHGDKCKKNPLLIR